VAFFIDLNEFGTKSLFESLVRLEDEFDSINFCLFVVVVEIVLVLFSSRFMLESEVFGFRSGNWARIEL
jgi:hypothetical protein